MPQASQERNYLSLRKGLNTVSNEITFPDEYTSDELNYTIEPDGSRKRRRGCKRESGGSVKTIQTGGTYFATNDWCRSYKWPSAGGRDGNDLIVHQIGDTLWFTQDAETVSTTFLSDTVDITAKARWADPTSSTVTAALVAAEPCSFAAYRGYLIVTNKYLKPFYVKVDASNNVCVNDIELIIRDFEGIDDLNVAIDEEPTGTITDSHNYNLRNRGWKAADITTYYTNQAKNPAKNMIWHLGYQRAAVDEFQETSGGIRSFVHGKMAAEVFSNSSAPQGSLFQKPLDTSVGLAIGGAGTGTAMSGASGSAFARSSTPTSSTVYLEMTATGIHSAFSATQKITVSGFSWVYIVDGTDYTWTTPNRSYTVITSGTPTIGQALVTTNTIELALPQITTAFDSWTEDTLDGQVDGSQALSNPDGSVAGVGPTACEAFAGRVWYAGMSSAEWTDTIFFSQISLKADTFGKCYQEADPTDELNSQLRSSDGGTIIIPNMGLVRELRATRNAILVFAENGVWEISGGRGGFTAQTYVVRQITDAGCNAPCSVQKMDTMVVYTGPKGVTALAPNQYTGQLEDQSLTAQVIQPTWNAIPAAKQQRVQSAYDDAKQRLYILYGESVAYARYLSMALVFDFKHQAWYKLGFNRSSLSAIDNDTGMLTVFAISEADSSATDQKIKFLVAVNDDGGSNHKVDICDMNQSDYEDFQDHNSHVEGPLPYLVTGWDSSVGSNRRRQSPIITVYNKRTSTGWTLTTTGSELVSNGTFTGNADGWTLGASWTYGANKVAHNGASGTSSITQTISAGLTRRAVYKLELTISDITSGSGVVTAYVGGSATTTFAGAATHTQYLTALTGNDLEIKGFSGGSPAFKVDGVSLKLTASTENNGGSTLMTPFWDWTDDTQWVDQASPVVQQDWSTNPTDGNTGVSGKIGKQVQTYKNIRSFAPTETDSVDGYPVIATRHKVRGRGRTLSLRFDGAAGKDSHLLGFTINYKISRRV